MKYIFIIILILLAFLSKAGIATDTIPYWHISYGKIVVIRGNLNSLQLDKHELTVKPESLKDLTISFVYDNYQPQTSSLTIKEGKEVLRKVEQDPVMGPNFIVPIRELIGTHQPNVRYELDFYYTDDVGQRDLKLGTIAFIFK